MAQHRWRDSPDVIARLIDKDSVTTWSSRDIVIKPNEACAIMKDGKVEDVLTETVMKGQVGGFGRWLGGKLGLGAVDSKLLFAITGPVNLCLPIKGQLANGEAIQGLGTLRVQIQRDHLPKLLNLFTNGPREITKAWLSTQLQREFDERVVRPLLSTTADAAELRLPAFQERFEMTAEVEMRNICELWGISMLKAFCSTDATDLEKAEALSAKIAAQTAQGEAITDAEIAGLERHESVMVRRIEAEFAQARAQARGQVNVELESELKGLRAEEARWEAELKVERQRMELTQSEREHKTDIAQSERQHKSDVAMSMFEQVQSAKRERMAQQSDANLERQKHTDDIQTEMMRMAADNGALTPEVMQSFLDNQSTQKQADQPLPSGASSKQPSDNQPAPTSASSICQCGQVLSSEWLACPSCGTQI
ncbi:MAG: hypothetical protein QGH90_07005 [Candidatus Poseidoniaceae archaeon]|jgi:hypothetical protein|nr:hypothetical protein [Candidatus Poseidoniaceae archaeon]